MNLMIQPINNYRVVHRFFWVQSPGLPPATSPRRQGFWLVGRRIRIEDISPEGSVQQR